MKRGAFFLLVSAAIMYGQNGDPKPWIWPSEPPSDCPFEQSKEWVGIALTSNFRHYPAGDTWYPSWAANDTLYSPWTDGTAPRLDGGIEWSISDGFYDRVTHQRTTTYRNATTGQAMLAGDDPLHLMMISLGTVEASPIPYGGRYPCGSLVHNGVWYYGTYCLSPYGSTTFGDFTYNWPWLGPLVGFRVSTDYGRSWKETPHTPEKPLFGETGMWGYPVKMGAPHFIDFGKNMQYSPDGKAYLVGMGATVEDPKPRFANLSWISGDQIYLCRITPTIDNINDAAKYEFFSGHRGRGEPLWTADFRQIKPLIDWNNNCGCVTMTYNAPLRKYLTVITDGWPTAARMNTYILESDEMTGPFRLVCYLKNFGEQAYFCNFPSKFVSSDGRRVWLAYSGNFAKDWNNMKIKADPPGSAYGLVLQEMILLDRPALGKYKNNPRPKIF